MIKKDKIDKNSHEYKTGFRDGIEYANEKLKEDGTFFQRIHDLISYDISTIWDEQGKGQDGMYSLSPDEMFNLNVTQRGDRTIERVFRNKVKGYEEYITRIYVLNCACGGICILGYKEKHSYNSETIYYTLFHLGEDDGFFFVHDDGSQGFNYMTKIEIIDMVSRAISLLNNIK
nr:MAG: hypothetical protein [Bacteriophage sp.]